MAAPEYVEAAIRDTSALGFYGIELFGNQIEAMETQGGVGALLTRHSLPLISAYCTMGLPLCSTSTPARASRRATKPGTVDVPGILSLMEGRRTAGLIMVDLDSPARQPAPALENGRIAKAYLEKQGVAFRS